VREAGLCELCGEAVDLIGEGDLRWACDTSSLGGFAELSRLEQLAGLLEIIVLSQNDEVGGFVKASEDPDTSRAVRRPQAASTLKDALPVFKALHGETDDCVGHFEPPPLSSTFRGPK
jgi:hypothetical protein